MVSPPSRGDWPGNAAPNLSAKSPSTRARISRAALLVKVTAKMFQGHRGANHPVQRVGGNWGDSEGLVEITSMNHGFAVDNATLPDTLEETHVSLFDGSNCGIAVKGKKAFGVQYHPEASPGPQDSFYLFEKFVGMLK